MKFSDQGIIISQKKYGENSLIVKVFSRDHGIYRGFVNSIKSSKSRSIFQIGNLISFEFRARNEDNLGQFAAVDLVKSYCSNIMFDALKINCANSIFSIVDHCFLERENHEKLFEKLQNFLQKLIEEDESKIFLPDYVKLELKILKTLGYGVDLSSCAATNSTTNLAYVSPKSARAVSLEAGKPYQNKLLKLPEFLIGNQIEIAANDLRDGLRLSGFFLEKFVFEDKKEKLNARNRLEKSLLTN
jgi:DNA repair protein RecO (recombination protein O)